MLRSGARRAMASDLPVTELDRLFVSPARTAREAALRAASSPSVWLKVLDRWHTMQAQGDAFPASREAASIAEMGSVAALLETPPVVAICGAPNTGKSTLFNALLGYSRSIDSPAEGTTHDSIREPLPLRGFTVVLSDTPGYGGSDAVWADILTSEAARAAAGADLAVLLLSPDAVLQPEELAQFHRALLVSGKADASPRMAEGAALAVSGLRGDNLSLLCDHIADMLGIPAENSSISFPLPFGQSFREAVICFSTSPSIEALANCRMELYNCLDLLMTRA